MKAQKISISEATLRDLLSKKLDLIEPELQFEQTEYHLPNSEGTKGFIDILAFDGRNRYVAIEVKKSLATTREAIQEVHKYIGLLRQNTGCRESEVRAIIVSPFWEELIVPFSVVKHQSNINLDGYLLELEDDKPVKAEKISPLPPSPTRSLSKSHRIFYASIEGDLNQMAKQIQQQLNSWNLSDYVLIKAKSPKIDRRFNYLLYLSIQEYSIRLLCALLYYEEQRNSINDSEPFYLFSWFENIRNGLIPSEKVDQEIETHVDSLISAFGKQHWNGKQSEYLTEELLLCIKTITPESDKSNPNKFETIFDIEGWTLLDVFTSGIYKIDRRFKGALFDSEIRGYDGSNPFKFIIFSSRVTRLSLRKSEKLTNSA